MHLPPTQHLPKKLHLTRELPNKAYAFGRVFSHISLSRIRKLGMICSTDPIGAYLTTYQKQTPIQCENKKRFHCQFGDLEYVLS